MADMKPYGNSIAGIRKMYDSKRRQSGFEEDERGHVNPQEPQHPENKHGEKYDNDTKEGWLHGVGDRPDFDHRDPKTGMPKRWNNT
jgi:hypothetical protein